jgi:hypothetical protein
MDELSVVAKARAFVSEAKPTDIPVPLEVYLSRIGAVLRSANDLEEDEAGFSFQKNGKWIVSVNANERLERQRFTACHELAHIVLGLPSEHGIAPWWSYAKRPMTEIFCDIFAAELLLPLRLLRPLAERMPIGFAAIDEIAGQFLTSRTASGSRFATIIKRHAPLSSRSKGRFAMRRDPQHCAREVLGLHRDATCQPALFHSAFGTERPSPQRSKSSPASGSTNGIAGEFFWRKHAITISGTRH